MRSPHFRHPKLTQYIPALLLALATMIFVIQPAYAQGPTDSAPPAAGPSQQLEPGQTPAGLTPAEWSAVQQAVAAAEYHFAYHEADADHPAPYYWAPNRAQGWQTVFTPHGVQVTPPQAGWQWGLTLTGYGYGNKLTGFSALPTLTADKAVITYHWNANLSEWWVNSPAGLEQGFTLQERPGAANGQPLQLEMAVTGNLTPAPQGEVIAFADGSGVTLLTYDKLHVTDARGQVIPARLSLAGGKTIRLTIDDARAVYPLTIDPWVQSAKLTAGDGAASDSFGIAVAISGDTMVVGANGDNSSQGAAYVFVKPSGGWATATETAKLTASDGAANASFGGAVSISGDAVIVGAAGAIIGSNSYQGAAYVYVKPSGVWTNTSAYTAKLTASDGAANHNFGKAVAISGDTAVVGTSNGNAVYIYEKPGGGWADATQTARIAGVTAGDGFGFAVAINSDTVVVGANFTDPPGKNNAGAAYVYVKPGGGWADTGAYTAKLTASDAAGGAELGNAVAINGDTVVVGAWSHNSYQGAAYVYEKPGGGWITATESAKLTASDGASFDQFGNAVAASGNTIAVGSYHAQIGSNNNQGAVYLYVKPDGGWTTATETSKLIAGDGAASDNFGRSVSLSSDAVVIGAAGANSVRGAAYVFTWVSPLTVAVTSTADSGVGSFRQAVAEVRSGGVITFDPTLNGQTISLTGGEIEITKTLTISGPETANLSLSGNNANRLFNVQSGGVLTLAHVSVISGNSADYGGGVYVDGGVLNVQDSAFSGNTAVAHGGAIYNDGGSLTLTDTDISGNVAGSSGGAIYNNGGSLTLTNARISGNIGNGGTGGAIRNDGGSATLTNILFSGNKAPSGGAIYNNNSSLQLTNATFSGNLAPSNPGGAIANYGSGTVQLVNGVLWGNSTSGPPGNQIYNTGGTTAISYTLIQSGTGTTDILGSVSFGPGVITSDPLFVAPITATVAPTTTGNYRLQTGSPAIDSGDNSAIAITTDLDGNTRIQGGVVDMGAFEALYTGPTANDDPNESTPEEVAVTISPLLNDTDPDSDPLTISAVGVPLNGTASISGTTQIVYTPALNFNGADVFTYTASDGGQTNTAAITVTVDPVNDAPQVTEPARWRNVGDAGFSGSAIDASFSLAFDSNDTLYVAYQSDFSSGNKATVMKYTGSAWVEVGAGGAASSGQASNISLALDSADTPYVAYKTATTGEVTVRKFDGSAWVDVGSADFSAGIVDKISLALAGDDTPYVAYKDGNAANKATVMKFNGTSWVVVGGAGFTSGPIGETGLAIDSGGTPYLAYADGNNSNRYTVAKFNGTGWDTLSRTGLPDAFSAYLNLAFDRANNLYMGYRDGDNSNKATVVKFNGASWTAVGNRGFTPNEAASVSLAFDHANTPHVAFGSGVSSLANLMKYTGTNWAVVGTTDFSAPYASYIKLAFNSADIPYVGYKDAIANQKATVMNYYGQVLTHTAITMSEDGDPTPFDLTLGGKDIDGDTLTWSIATPAISGTALASGTGLTQTIGYTPTLNWHGGDSFTVQVSDGALTDTITVSVTVESVNDAPLAVDDTADVDEGLAVTISPLLNDTDPETDTLTIGAVGSPANGTVSLSGTTQLVYTATLNYLGTDVFTYTASDGLLTDTATITVTIGCPTAFTVTTTADSGFGSLRYVVGQSCAEGKVITFDPALNGSTITLTGGEIAIDRAVTISGPGAEQITVSGNNAGRIFNISQPVSISGLTLQEGSGPDYGGAINSTAGLTLTAVTMLSNTVTTDIGGYGGGAVNVDGGDLLITDSLFRSNRAVAGSDPDADAGAVWVNGNLTITNTQFIDNSADNDDGAVEVLTGDAHIADSLFQGNQALGSSPDGNYGALELEDGSLWLTNTDFLSNTAATDAGALYAYSPAVISDSMFQGNSAGDDVGVMEVEDSLTISDSQFINNTAVDYGGAVYGNNPGYNVTVSNSLFRGNSAGGYGGVMRIKGTLVITNTDFLSNTAAAEDGALYAESDATISDSLFRGNSAGDYAGVMEVDGALVIANSRFIHNTAATYGGALVINDDAQIINSLLAGNHSDSGTGAALYVNGGAVVVQHTTIASATLGSGSAIEVSVGTLNADHNIIAQYDTGISNSDTVNEDYNLFAGNTTSMSGVTAGTHSWSSSDFSDAAFVDAAGGNFHLTSSSWALNKGTDVGVTEDFDGDARPGGGGFDLGYDETAYAGPTANDDPDETTNEELAVTISPLVNDTDPENDALSLTAVGSPAHGTVTLSGTTQIVYTPTLNYVGTDSFTYTAREASQLTATATITVTVDPANDAPQVVQNSGDFLAKWGVNGSGDGQFSTPFGVAADGSGNVYVVDTGNNRIQKLDNAGNFLSKWGSNGSGNGQFSVPNRMAVDSDGNIYVADTYNYRIQKFDSSGVYVTQWGSNGSGDGQFKLPSDVAVDGSGNVYVADTNNHRIQKFTGSGGYLAQWGSPGSGNGQFSGPTGVAVDGSGYVYVADTSNNRIQKFDGNGNFVAKWGGVGSGNGQFNVPNDVAVDGRGYVYVADTNNHRIQKFTGNGNFVAKWGKIGTDGGQFVNPFGVAADGSGHIYVADSSNNRIQKFTAGGAPITSTIAITMSEDGTPTPFNLTLSGADIDGDALTWSVITPAISGTAVISAANATTATLGYTPTANWYGSDSFTVRVSDGSLSDTVTVSVTVQSVNDAPVAVNDTSTTTEDTPLTISPLLNDTDVESDTLTVSAIGSPAHGTATISGATQVVYTPTTAYIGTDVFTYTASDGVLTDSAVITVTVNAANAAPSANAGSDQTVAQTATVQLDGSASSDPDSDPLTYGWAQTGGSPALTLSDSTASSPTFTAGSPGVFTFTLTVTDTLDQSDSDQVVITVDTDADGDGIADNVEGTTVDTDLDGTPDYQDTDSDGDGELDSAEGDGDADSDGIPDRLESNTYDGDGDTTPDYLDTDSDGDGTPDSAEGFGDSDSDGIPDRIESNIADPDSDTTANYLDTDSDGDGTLDSAEGYLGDVDRDGIPNYLDDQDRLIYYFPIIQHPVGK